MVKLTDIKLPELAELPDINRKGGISAAESYAVHRPRLANDAARYDPRVLVRIMRGREQDAADYIELLNIRADFIDPHCPANQKIRRSPDADHSHRSAGPVGSDFR